MQVNFYAAARAAAGISAQTVQAEVLGEVPSLQALITYLKASIAGSTATGMSFATVLDQCSFLLDGHKGEPSDSLEQVQRVDVLPPFAGG